MVLDRAFQGGVQARRTYTAMNKNIGFDIGSIPLFQRLSLFFKIGEGNGIGKPQVGIFRRIVHDPGDPESVPVGGCQRIPQNIRSAETYGGHLFADYDGQRFFESGLGIARDQRIGEYIEQGVVGKDSQFVEDLLAEPVVPADQPQVG